MNQASVEEAQKLLDQAGQYVKDNKVDLADKTVKQLENMKGKLPAEYGPKIEALRKAVDAAKAATMPGIPGGMKMPG